VASPTEISTGLSQDHAGDVRSFDANSLVRLLAVIIITSACVWIQRIQIAVAAFALSLLFVLIAPRRNLKILGGVTAITVFSYLFGNLVFSPELPHSLEWWIFRVNGLGLHNGVVAAAKRSAMLCFSLAWLWSTSFPQTYAALGWIDRKNKYILLFLRNTQIIWRELLQFRQSINTRSPVISFISPRQLTKLRLMIQAVVIRMFDTVGRITYSAEIHHTTRHLYKLITLSEVSVRYEQGRDYALKHISCTFETGEFVYLGGLNGAGKTTLLRILAGYIPRIEGEYGGNLLFGDQNVNSFSLRDYSSCVKYVPSEPSLSIIGLTVGQEISSVSESQTDAKACLQKMGIIHLWSRETVKLSGGEQVRLILACALASKAPFILLDSPLEQLDAEGRGQFLSGLQELLTLRNVTVIVADPHFEIIKPFVTRFLLLEKGEIGADISAHEITSNHLLRAGISDPDTRSMGATGSGEPLAELRDVQLVFDGIQVLRGINFAIQRGEFVAIVGENGSGKTTAMLVLAGLYKIQRGFRIANLPIRYVFQDAFLQMVGVNCEEELSIGPQFYQWPLEKQQSFVSSELQWVGVTADQEPVQLHTGKARLLSIAAMNFDAEGVLILDEPTIGLDKAGIKTVMDLIDSIVASGSSVIAITHDPLLSRCASRIITMKNGLIIKDDRIYRGLAVQEPKS
jgi:energy-coupling factor transport system ATP-binding protein